MLLAVRCTTTYILAFGVIINVFFIGLTQVLYISQYFKKSSSSSSSSSRTSLSSSISNKSEQIENPRCASVVKRDVTASSPQFTTVNKNRSASHVFNAISNKKGNENANNSLKQSFRTKEQMRKVNELKKKIANEIKPNFPYSRGREGYGGIVKLLVSPEKFCRPSSSALTLTSGLLVIMVTSRVKEERVREAIRQTWADVPEVKSGQVRVVYLLGTTLEHHESTQYLIKREADDNDDIIQGDFEDTYKNLTTKTLMGLQWAAVRCANSFKYFMKTDSDVYVNLPKLAGHLAGLNNWDKLHAFGRKWVDVKPIRSPVMKWFVPESEYPGSTYPPYLGGSAYVMTSLAVRKTYHEARSTKLVRLEDLFVGICFNKAGVKLSDEPRFSVSLDKIMSRPCDIHLLFTHHGVKPYNLHQLKMVQDHPDRCFNGTYLP